MKKILPFRPITVSVLAFICCLCISCSHLNVDFDSSWSARDIRVVVVEHQQPPDEVTTADIADILTRSGWHVVADRHQAQARVVCRWARETDLNAETDAIEVVKSFHVQIISVDQPKVLAVSDYFYSNPHEKLIVGVNKALTALTQKPEPIAAEPIAAEPVAPKVQPIAAGVRPVDIMNDVPADKVSAAITANPVVQDTMQQTATEQVVNTPQPVAKSLVDEKTFVVEPLTPAVPEQQVLPLESAEPVNMERSPWIPRFQGMGFDEWGK